MSSLFLRYAHKLDVRVNFLLAVSVEQHLIVYYVMSNLMSAYPIGGHKAPMLLSDAVNEAGIVDG